MEVVALSHETLPGVLFQALKVIKNGGIVVYPTDTVYGIGGNGLDESLARRIYAIKERPEEKAMIMLVRDIAMARSLAYIDLGTEEMLSRIWPGPITAVFQKKDSIPASATGGLETVALRWPRNEFIEKIMQQVDFPLIGTSCNTSGESSRVRSLGTFIHAMEVSRIKPNLVIDAGELPEHIPSTILDLTKKKRPVMLREGEIKKEELERILGVTIESSI